MRTWRERTGDGLSGVSPNAVISPLINPQIHSPHARRRRRAFQYQFGIHIFLTDSKSTACSTLVRQMRRAVFHLSDLRILIVRFLRKTPANDRKRRMIGHRFVQRDVEERAQRKRIGATSGAAAFGVDAFEIADQVHAEIHAGSNPGAAALLIVGRAEVFNEGIEPGGLEQFVDFGYYIVVQHRAGRTGLFNGLLPTQPVRCAACTTIHFPARNSGKVCQARCGSSEILAAEGRQHCHFPPRSGKTDFLPSPGCLKTSDRFINPFHHSFNSADIARLTLSDAESFEGRSRRLQETSKVSF